MSTYPPPPEQEEHVSAYIQDTDAQHIQDATLAEHDLEPTQDHDTQHDADTDELPFSLEKRLQQSEEYDRIEHETALDPQAAAQIERRIEQLQNQPETDDHSAQANTEEPPDQSGVGDHDTKPAGSGEELDIAPSEYVDLESYAHDQESPKQKPVKLNRLRKACDSCSARKVKCDEGGQPCKACAALDIPCTYNRPSRRRGPANKHAEAIKRRRLEGSFQPVEEEPRSSSHAAQALADLSSQISNPQISAESICAVETIDLLINDYFTHIHPLCPFPHEPSFREAWRRREDYSNLSFLALLASMLAALIASFPRRPRIFIKSLQKGNPPPNHLALVEKCQKVCALSRGSGYLDNESLSVHDAATSYLLGMAAFYTFNWRQGKLYLGESYTILKALGMHLPKEDTFNDLGHLPTILGSDGPTHEGSRDAIVDKITLQMGRRIYWTLFVTDKSMSQLGNNPSELSIVPDATMQSQPPVPEDVDDYCIFPDHIDAQPEGQYPLVNASNSLVNLYFMTSLRPKLQPENNNSEQWSIDIDAYRTLLHECRTRMVAELYSVADPEPLGRDPASLSVPQTDLSGDERRALQQRIQSAHLYAAALCIRIETVDTVLHALDTRSDHRAGQNLDGTSLGGEEGMIQDDALREEMLEERDAITNEIVTILANMDQINIWPNADKPNQCIRFVASTLINAPREHMGPILTKAETDIRAVLELLSQLEQQPQQHQTEDDAAGGLEMMDAIDEDMRRLNLVQGYQATLGLQSALRHQV